MERKSDIRSKLFFYAMIPALGSNNTWRAYGFKKRPRYGSFVAKMFPRKYELQEFINQELFILGFVDVLVGIQYSHVSNEDKALLVASLFDSFLYYSPKSRNMGFIDAVFVTFLDHKNPAEKRFSTSMLKRSKSMSKINQSKYIYGTQVLMYDDAKNYFFIDSEKIIDLIRSNPVPKIFDFYDVDPIEENRSFRLLLQEMEID